MSDEEWQAIVDAAIEEGEVTVYGVVSTNAAEALPVAFAEDYPDITLNYVRMAPADIEARIEAELASGLEADVIESATPTFMQPLSDEGSLVPPVGPAFSDPDYPFEEMRATPEAFATFGSAYTWAWNTDLVPDGITSWDDFLTLEPGLLGLVDPSIGPAMVDFYKSLEEAAGEGFLDKLAAAGLEPQIYPGGNPAAAALAAGEIGAAVAIGGGSLAIQQAAGAPVESTVYEHAWLPTTWSMILKDSPHPNAAQVYANWIISQHAQQLFADLVLVPFLGSVESIVPEGVELRTGQDVTADEVAAFQERWNQLFG